MKRVLAILLLLSAGAALHSLPMMIGFQYNMGDFYFSTSQTNRVSGTTTRSRYNEMNLSQESLGMFFDMHYARVSVAYNFINMPGYYTISNEVRIDSRPVVNPFKFTSLDIGIMGKLPIEFSADANLWFGAGVEYSINLTFDEDGNGTNDLQYGTNDEIDGRNMNDLYGVLACGFTLNLNDTIAITPTFTFKYDFNHMLKTDAYLTDPTGQNIAADQLEAYKKDNFSTFMKFDLGIGLAIRL